MTLINTDGAGRRAMNDAFTEVFGRDNGFYGISFAGMTDSAIIRHALEKSGIGWDAAKEDSFKSSYFDKLRTEIKQAGSNKRVNPGIAEILPIWHEDEETTLALLTGNCRVSAAIKLEFFDLLKFFEFGVYSDDSEYRDELPRIAAERFAQRKGTSIVPDQVFVVGDTPRDVACARPYGARSVAVATGLFSVAELLQSEPDYLFQDLSDVESFLAVLAKNNRS
jgi:phosphoglycolate phosphatase-like HAD superfamily hydrolase